MVASGREGREPEIFSGDTWDCNLHVGVHYREAAGHGRVLPRVLCQFEAGSLLLELSLFAPGLAPCGFWYAGKVQMPGGVGTRATGPDGMPPVVGRFANAHWQPPAGSECAGAAP